MKPGEKIEKRYNQSLPEDILSKNGYKEIETDSHMDIVYVEESVYDKYKERFDKYDKEGTRMVKVDNIVNPLYEYFGMRRPWRNRYHYIPLVDPLYIHFCRSGDSIEPSRLNEMSNKVTSLGRMNRPIVVYHLDPRKSQILMRDEKYTMEVVKISELRYWCFTITREDGEVYKMYVLDHEFEGVLEPKIVRFVEEGKVEGKEEIGEKEVKEKKEVKENKEGKEEKEKVDSVK